MKQNILSIVLLLVMTTVFFSCSKSDETPNNNSGSGTQGNKKQRISFTLNGTSYTVTAGETSVSECKAHIRSGNQYQLVAKKGGNIDLYMKNLDISGTGTYTINEGSPLNTVTWNNGSKIYTSLIGQTPFKLNVTNVAGNSSDHVRLIEGTFSGTLYKIADLKDSIVLTAGKIELID